MVNSFMVKSREKMVMNRTMIVDDQPDDCRRATHSYPSRAGANGDFGLPTRTNINDL